MNNKARAAMTDPDTGNATESAAYIVNFHASPLAVRDALQTLLEYLEPLQLSQDQSETIEIVLAETLNNVTEHAYDDTGGPIYMRAVVGGGKLSVVIRDRGVSLPPRLILSDDPGGFDPDALPEGGFGWHLIRSLATELSHNRLAKWNELKVVFLLG
jgi:serine/threonine-protein kinase RsbW